MKKDILASLYWLKRNLQIGKSTSAQNVELTLRAVDAFIERHQLPKPAVRVEEGTVWVRPAPSMEDTEYLLWANAARSEGIDAPIADRICYSFMLFETPVKVMVDGPCDPNWDCMC